MPPAFITICIARAQLPFIPLFLLWAIIILFAVALAPLGLALWAVLTVVGSKAGVFFSPRLWLGLWELLCSLSGFEVNVRSDEGAFSFRL